jgi:hypothetical protein
MAVLPQINQVLAFYPGPTQASLLDYNFKTEANFSQTLRKVSEIKHPRTGNDKSFYPSVLSGVWK